MTAPIEDRGPKTERAVTLYREGRTIREIAADLGVSYGTAHDLIRQGGQTFRPRGKRARR